MTIQAEVELAWPFLGESTDRKERKELVQDRQKDGNGKVKYKLVYTLL